MPEEVAGNQPQPEQSNEPSSLERLAASLDEGEQQPTESPDQNPEPAGEAEGEAEAEPETAEGGDEEDAEYLPDEQSKVFPDAEYEKYAQKRYPELVKILKDPNQPGPVRESVKQILHDKINSDIQLRHTAEAEAEEEPTLEAEAPRDQPAADPAKQQEEYQRYVEQVVTQAVDPKAAEGLGLELLKAMGTDLSDEKNEETKALRALAPNIGKVLAKGAVDLNLSVLPQMLPRIIEQAFPGLPQMYERAMYANAWDVARGADANLPDYGTREFASKLRAAGQQIPGFDQMVFRDPQGRVLPFREQAKMKYEVLAKVMKGQKVDPAVVAQAVETGKKVNQDANRRRAQGKALGAGQSTNKLAAAKGEDDFKSMIEQYNESQRSTPLK